MANIRIIGNPGSKARKDISDHTGIKLYTGQRDVDAIVNYGVSGHSFDTLLRKYPAARNIPIINKRVGHSKYSVARKAGDNGILVPETLLELKATHSLNDWIEKRVNSSQGIGIKKATRRGRLIGKYYQKFISKRKHELRIHAFSWLPKSEWTISKRVGPKDQIAWNFHQGGHFIDIHDTERFKTCRAGKDIAEKVLKLCNMSFGAVDLIVTDDFKVYFIEVNSSPGFSALNLGAYVYAMNTLKNLSSARVVKYGII